MKVSVFENRYIKNVKVNYENKNYKVKKPPLDKSSESESESESSSFSHSNSESTSQSFFLKNGEPLPVCFNWSGVETGGLVEASHELAHDQNFSSVEEIAEYCGTHPYCNFFTYPEGKLYSTADTDVPSCNRERHYVFVL